MMGSNEIDTKGNTINKGTINVNDFKWMKLSGTIIDYKIDDNGGKAIKKFDSKEDSFT